MQYYPGKYSPSVLSEGLMFKDSLNKTDYEIISVMERGIQTVWSNHDSLKDV